MKYPAGNVLMENKISFAYDSCCNLSNNIRIELKKINGMAYIFTSQFII